MTTVCRRSSKGAGETTCSRHYPIKPPILAREPERVSLPVHSYRAATIDYPGVDRSRPYGGIPLRTKEVIVEMQLQSYVYYGGDFPTATELEGYTDDLPYQDELICGFIFKVTRPKKYEGQFVTSHHDGTLPSGPARAIAEIGKKYLWRTDSRAIGGRDFDLCSMALYGMKEVSAGSDDPRYRMWFVQTPKARDQDSKQKK